jgi:hypothetical protein
VITLRLVGGPSDGAKAELNCTLMHEGPCCFIEGGGLYVLEPGWPGAPDKGEDGVMLAYWRCEL